MNPALPTSAAVHPGQTRYEGDPATLALLLPGAGWYTPARPLLHLARAVLVRHRWTVKEVWWNPPTWSTSSAPWPDAMERHEWVAGETRRALEGEHAEKVLLVGKSLGSLAASVAAERTIPAIWLAPILREPTLVNALSSATAPTMLVGGTADIFWDGAIARELGMQVVEVPGADHSLETDDDPINSAAILGRVTREMDRFIRQL